MECTAKLTFYFACKATEIASRKIRERCSAVDVAAFFATRGFVAEELLSFRDERDKERSSRAQRIFSSPGKVGA